MLLRRFVMQTSFGEPASRIWLLGDSNPKNWEDKLASPLDPRHPARHNIWTSVMDEVQDMLYRQRRLRVDTHAMYIRNAIQAVTDKPLSGSIKWDDTALNALKAFRAQLQTYHPPIVFSFGRFAYEFARRALEPNSAKPYGHWGARGLGKEFKRGIHEFDPQTINLLPLLHVSISRGRFLESHQYFCDLDEANYFEYVGGQIATILLEHQSELPIWIET
jgi:hypothetical protein